MRFRYVRVCHLRAGSAQPSYRCHWCWSYNVRVSVANYYASPLGLNQALATVWRWAFQVVGIILLLVRRTGKASCTQGPSLCVRCLLRTHRHPQSCPPLIVYAYFRFSRPSDSTCFLQAQIAGRPEQSISLHGRHLPHDCQIAPSQVHLDRSRPTLLPSRAWRRTSTFRLFCVANTPL